MCLEYFKRSTVALSPTTELTHCCPRVFAAPPVLPVPLSRWEDTETDFILEDTATDYIWVFWSLAPHFLISFKCLCQVSNLRAGRFFSAAPDAWAVFPLPNLLPSLQEGLFVIVIFIVILIVSLLPSLQAGLFVIVIFIVILIVSFVRSLQAGFFTTLIVMVAFLTNLCAHRLAALPHFQHYCCHD